MIEKRNMLLAAINKLLNNQYIQLGEISENTFNNVELFLSYFNSDFDQEKESQIEKVLSVALHKTVNSLDFISDDAKNDFSLQTSMLLVDILRSMKLDYKYAEDAICESEYQEYLQENQAAKIAARVAGFCNKTTLIKVADKAVDFISYICQSMGVPLNDCIYLKAKAGVCFVMNLIPSSVYNKINGVIEDTTKECVLMIQYAIKFVKEKVRYLKERLKEFINSVLPVSESSLETIMIEEEEEEEYGY